MAIEWEEVDPQAIFGPAQRLFIGAGESGEEYKVWYGGAYLNFDTRVTRWIVHGWPEPDSDRLPLLDDFAESIALCEKWEEIRMEAKEGSRKATGGSGRRKIREEAERRAREAFTGTRAGEG